MKTSENGLELIKLFEGLSLTAYRCPAKVLTIGYGHTATAKEGMVITEQRANELLKWDVERFEYYINKKFNDIKFEQYEFDALISFCYNLGSITGNMRSSLYMNNTEYTVEMFSKYVKGGGKYLLGLHRRRLLEANLFCGLKLTAIEQRAIRMKYNTEQIEESFKELKLYVRNRK